MLRALLVRTIPILSAVGLAFAPLDELGENRIYFDILQLSNLHLLLVYLLTGIIAAIAFIIAYHVMFQNHTFSIRDAFFFMTGPTVGLLLALGGATQFDVIQYTFVLNMGLGGVKELLKKVTGLDLNNVEPLLTQVSNAQLLAEIDKRTKKV